MDAKNKNGKIACAGAAGSMGLAGLAGACSVGCGAVAAPLFAILTSAGFGTLASILPRFQIPLVLIALGFGIYSLSIFVRQKNALGAAVTALVMGAGSVFTIWQILAANSCGDKNTVGSVLEKLSPQSKLVFQKGVYPLWPTLGRAPSIDEIRQSLGYESNEPVLAAFGELEKIGIRNVFFPGTKDIKWLWPFSSLDHGVEVTLGGGKPVHARCAIDALGMSAMFDKPARVSIKTPLDGTLLSMEIDNDRVITAQSGIVVSYSDSCDDMLFFSSRDEFDRYVKSSGKTHLKLYSLQDALRHGIESFGKVLKS